MPMCFNTFICRFLLGLSLIMAFKFQWLYGNDNDNDNGSSNNSNSHRYAQNCVVVFFPASHIEWFRLLIRWSSIYPVRALCTSNLFMSISHFTTFQRGIMPFSMSVFMLCPLTKRFKHIQNHNDKMQHRKKMKKKKTKRMMQVYRRRWKDIEDEAQVDRHLPWSNQQQTTYRCQYDWFGCLFGCACSVPRLISSSLSVFFIFFFFFFGSLFVALWRLTEIDKVIEM